MKLKTMIVVIMVITLSAFIFSTAAEKVTPPTSQKCQKIGIVSVRKIFQDCKRNMKYKREMSAERDKMEAELEKLSKEIDLDKAEIKTLKQNSSDYSNRMREILEKQAKLQAQQEFYKRQMDIREQNVIEQLFKDVMQATNDVAKEKSFDMVFERSEPELPASNSNELTLAISTHKILYAGCCEDITDAVLAKVDANTP